MFRTPATKFAAVLTSAMALLATVALPAAAEAQAASTDEYIVILKDQVSAQGVDTVAASASATPDAVFTEAIHGFSATLNDGQVRALASNPEVSYIERNVKLSISGARTPTASWGLDRIDQRALPLDNSTTNLYSGAGVTVYVLDTGINAEHQEFTGRLATGFSGVSGEPTTDDCQGHGTHVAGTIAGSTYGVAPGATVVPVRVLGCDGTGTVAEVLAGIDWVIANHVSGPAVANMSLGVDQVISSINQAVTNMIADGVSTAVAAGNESIDACGSTPAAAPNAVTVGATDADDAEASFSNYGSCLDIYAPGVGITSSSIGSPTASEPLDGTSMASPHVAGVMALMLDAAPESTPAEVATAIGTLATSGVVTGVTGAGPNKLLYAPSDGQFGLGNGPSAPQAPTGAATKAGDGSADVSWKAPADDGGFAVTGYTVTDQSGATVCQTSELSCTASGLNNGSRYKFKVTATNQIGTSAPSQYSNQVMLTGKPASPTKVMGLRASGGRVVVSWRVPANGGSAITGYTVTSSDGKTCTTTTKRNCTITGLTAGQTYTFTVTATNKLGTSAPSSPSGPVKAL